MVPGCPCLRGCMKQQNEQLPQLPLSHYIGLQANVSPFDSAKKVGVCPKTVRLSYHFWTYSSFRPKFQVEVSSKCWKMTGSANNAQNALIASTVLTISCQVVCGCQFLPWCSKGEGMAAVQAFVQVWQPRTGHRWILTIFANFWPSVSMRFNFDVFRASQVPSWICGRSHCWFWKSTCQ
jgi:hypothetical protein